MSPLTLLAGALLAAAQMPAGPPADVPRPIVEDVQLRLPAGENPKEFQGLVAIEVGAPLTPRATQRTVRALYQSGKFGNVRIYSSPTVQGTGADRVRIEVVCEPRRLVASTRFEVRGETSAFSEDALRQIAGLERGAELYPGRLEVAVTALRGALERRGYRQATVSARVEGDLQAAVIFAVDTGPPTRVASVALGPETGIPAAELAEGLRTRKGAVLDLDDVKTDTTAIRERLRKARYYRARVGEPAVVAEGAEATVSFPVEAGPRFSLRFVGDTPFPSERLRQQLGYEGDVPLDTTAIEAAADHLRTFLADFGYNEARVWAEERGSSQQVTVVFHVDAGRRYLVRSLRFEGAQFRTVEWLEKNLRETLAAEPPLEVPQPRADLDALAVVSGLGVKDPVPYLSSDPTEVYRESAWKQAAQKVAEGYRNEGFLDATVDVTKLNLVVPPGFVDVEVRVQEGPRTMVESVTFDGNVHFPTADLARVSKLAAADPLSLARVAETRQAVVDLYFKKGYVFARVEAAEEFTADRGKAALRFRVEEGPEVHIAAVVVQGNKRTSTALIERTVGIRPGQVFDPTEAAAAQTELLRLGVFRSVSLHLSEPEVAQATKDLVVDVEERPYQTVIASAGLSFAEGPRAAVEYDRPNVFGDAIDFAARLRVNYPLEIFRPDLLIIPPEDRWEALAEVGFRFPRAFDLRILNLRTDLVGQHKVESAYLLSRGALILGADLVRLGRFSFTLAGQLEMDDVTSTTGCSSVFCLGETPEVARLLFPTGFTTLVSIQPRVSLDLRDSAVRPTTGVFLEVNADYSHSIGTPDTIVRSDNYVNLIKLQGVFSTYLPLWTSVLALSARWGQVFPINDQSVTIAPKRFYLGGATTMRGYGENEMIPEDQRESAALQTQRCASIVSGLGCSSQQQQLVRQGIILPSEGGAAIVLFKAELRVPMTRITELGLFVDYGNLWLDPALVDLAKLRTNIGLGLRILTPVGPAAFDVGFNLNPDAHINEPVMAPHFAVGFF
ncbi:MAG TPA: POTRA domain-containing protein [Anaeromyxobacteraceae bacterium]|nr:POTRA domain-containing protein [Anaeromyxobacteraceae bacterium]